MHIDEPSQPHQIENSANDFSSSASLSNTFYDMGDTSVSSKLSALVNQEDMDGLKRSQEFISAKLIKTNDRLKQFNQFSSDTLRNQQWKFEENTKVLLDLHKDLVAISSITRSLRHKLSQQYPEEAKQATESLADLLPDNNEDE
ncbi:uncharacterized protein LOC134856724 [Symsagittifera roscoffensis]|uniref:uncharacterized protein LOC134856724 n=1 Tax=Symsagittifera roscoffensis TaxID=84072 RepID=UPI00307C73A6